MRATFSTEWLSLREFCAFYRISPQSAARFINRGIIVGVRIGHAWRVYNPGYHLMLTHHRLPDALEHAYALSAGVAAKLIGIRVDSLDEARERGMIRARQFIEVGHPKWYYQLTEVRRYMFLRNSARKGKKTRKLAGLKWAERRLASVPYEQALQIPKLGDGPPLPLVPESEPEPK